MNKALDTVPYLEGTNSTIATPPPKNTINKFYTFLTRFFMKKRITMHVLE